MTQAFHLRLFGPPVLLDGDGERVKFRTKKHLALLVYLAIERDPAGVSRERLVDLLWPSVGPRRGRHSLSQSLTAIRSLVGRDAVQSIGPRIRLHATLRTDLDVVREASRPAIDFAKPLEDFEDCAGVDFAHWVDASRERLTAGARAGLLNAFHDARRHGDGELRHKVAEQLYRVDPTSGPAVQSLAEHALVAGDVGRAAALLREFLPRAEARGNGQHANVRRLLERIESGAHPTTAAPGKRGGDGKEYFVGRSQELGRLEGLWERAMEGELRTCLTRGVAGIGKSSLLRRFATSVAARGNLALVIRCQEIGNAVPFAALADLIEELSRDPALGATDPYWLAEASRVAPILKTRYPGLPTPDNAPGEAIRLRVAEALYRMLETVAEGSPVLIAIDDIQHLDHASRDVLHLLARRLTDDKAMLLAAARSEGFESGGWPAGGPVEIVKWQLTIDLATLNDEEANTLASRLTADLADYRGYHRIEPRIVQLAAGNPYFLEMLVSDWRAHGEESLAAAVTWRSGTGAKWRPPDTLRLTFSRHYEGLRTEGRQALELLAVAARAMDAAELGGLLGHSVGEGGQILLEIIERGVLRLDGDAASFKNELHRAFVYYAMSDESRRYHHARLARASLQLGRPLEASHHFVQAGMVDEAMASAIDGAEAAVAYGAPREAERALRQTLETVDEPPTTALLLLSEALNQQEHYTEALRWLGDIDHTTSTDEERRRVAALRAEAMVRGRVGDDSEIQAAIERGLRLAKLTKDDAQVLKILQSAAELAADQGNLANLEAAEAKVRSIELADDNKEARGHAELTTGFCLFARGRFARAYRHLATSAKILEQTGHPELVRALNGSALCAWSVGEVALGREAHDRALYYSERTGNYPAACNVATNLASMLAEIGTFAEAEQFSEKAMAFEKRVPHCRYSYHAFNNAAALAIVAEDFPRATVFLRKAEIAARESGRAQLLAQILFHHADWHLARNQIEEALDTIAAAEALWSPKSAHPALSYQASDLRLVEYRAWRLGKLDVAPAQTNNDFPPQLCRFIAWAAFREWLCERVGRPSLERPNAKDMIKATGFTGIERTLRVVGMFPTGAGSDKVRNMNAARPLHSSTTSVQFR